jgi:hypothetical protein
MRAHRAFSAAVDNTASPMRLEVMNKSRAICAAYSDLT